jgi:hypothetical protein
MKWRKVSACLSSDIVDDGFDLFCCVVCVLFVSFCYSVCNRYPFCFVFVIKHYVIYIVVVFFFGRRQVNETSKEVK